MFHVYLVRVLIFHELQYLIKTILFYSLLKYLALYSYSLIYYLSIVCTGTINEYVHSYFVHSSEVQYLHYNLMDDENVFTTHMTETRIALNLQGSNQTIYFMLRGSDRVVS